MISTDSKFHSCKNSILSTIHQPLQIRTNKHRCFVFCIGHTSLTCVPGIGKKNKYLLNKSGINDLSTLYSKYRSINNIQHFKQWLENEIGFTSYQAKMTSCGIGSKLGEIKEINTGLIPICCPAKERREEKNIHKRDRSIQSKNEKNKEQVIKKRKTENIKLENVSSISNQDQIESKQKTPNKEESLISSSINNSINKKEKLTNMLSDNDLTGVKSPSMKDKDKPDLTPTPKKLSFDRKYQTNELSKTKSIKFTSSSMMNEMTRDNTDSLELTKQNSLSLKKNSKKSDQQKKNEIQTKKSSTSHNSTLASDFSMRNKPKSEQLSTHDANLDKVKNKLSDNQLEFQKSIENVTTEKSPMDKRAPSEIVNDQTKTHSSSIFSQSDNTTKLKSTNDEKLNEIFTLTKEKLQSTLNALQDKKNELLSASKISPDSSIAYEHPKKLILSSTQTSETDRIKTAIKDGIDSNTKSKSDERSSDKINSKNISNSIKLTLENNFTTSMDQLTSFDSKFNTTSPLSHSGTSPTIEKEDIKQHDELTPISINDTSIQKTTSPHFSDKLTPTSISEDKRQESIPNQFDITFNESDEQKFYKEINKTVSEIMKQAAQITHKDIVQSTPAKCIPLAERLAQEKAKKLAALIGSNNKDAQPLRVFEQENSVQKKFFPFTSDRLKQSSTNTSSPSQINQFKNDKTTSKQNPNDQDSKMKNQSVKPSPITDKKTNNDHRQHEKLGLTSKLPTLTNTSPAMHTSSPTSKISLTTLSSLSDSNLSINRTNLSMENIQYSSTDIEHLEKEIGINKQNDSKKSIDIVMSSDSLNKQKSSLLNDRTNHKKDKLNSSIIPFNSINQLPLPQNIKDNQFINENLSKTVNSKENFELKINSNSTESKHPSISSPSSPVPCNALWNNISNEKLLCQRKKHHLTRINKQQYDQKINQYDYNQNHHSSTTLFRFFTRQQHLEERQALNEHILYIKQIKTIDK